jgi:hypothetical protein
MDAASCQPITPELTIHGTKCSFAKPLYHGGIVSTIWYYEALSYLIEHMLDNIKKLLKLIKMITSVEVNSTLIVPETLIRSLALHILDQIWSWNLVCISHANWYKLTKAQDSKILKK